MGLSNLMVIWPRYSLETISLLAANLEFIGYKFVRQEGGTP